MYSGSLTVPLNQLQVNKVIVLAKGKIWEVANGDSERLEVGMQQTV
jgi:hypothetical protein